MVKSFSPRISKKERKQIDVKNINFLEDRVINNNLLEGASLIEMDLKEILVKDQVRTKFYDHSIKELAKNIKENGLIQPLVINKQENKYVLICGERRFRAMTSIEIPTAPCFVLDNKTEEELMAIQFSENSSREALHYIDKADGILNYQRASKLSERKITAALGISKSEVHRSLLIAKLPKRIKEAVKIYNTEKYVLLEYGALENGQLKKRIERKIVSGEITKRSQFKKIVKTGEVKSRLERRAPELPKGLTANAFLQAMKSRSKNLDPKTRKLLNNILEESKEIVDI